MSNVSGAETTPSLSTETVASSGAGRLRRYESVIRPLEVAISAAMLVLLSPAMLLIAGLIKLSSPGPVLFRQTRIGRNRRGPQRPPANGHERRGRNLFGEPFEIYKFRTMVVDARKRFPELYKYEHTQEELHALPIKVLVGNKSAASSSGEAGRVRFTEDPRVTWIGRWLRRTSLDELPNFLNVLTGEMRLVGPRPDIYENITYYAGKHMRKLDVKPGITGLAQIKGRGALSFYQTNELDARYVEKRSFLYDLKILLRTVPAALKGKGAA